VNKRAEVDAKADKNVAEIPSPMNLGKATQVKFRSFFHQHQSQHPYFSSNRQAKYTNYKLCTCEVVAGSVCSTL